MGARKGYNPKNKGKKSYQPILTFMAETHEYIWGELRNGDRPDGKQIARHLQGVFAALPPESVSHNRAYFVVVVVAVGKWEAAFCFPLFHGLLRLSVRSACQCFWVERRVLFKLHRADIVQRRVHSCLVIPEQPVQGLILGLA
jgi:hypothetical protein